MQGYDGAGTRRLPVLNAEYWAELAGPVQDDIDADEQRDRRRLVIDYLRAEVSRMPEPGGSA